MWRNNVRQSGVSLIEVIIATSVVAIMIVAVGFSVTAYVSARAALLNDAKSLYLAEEGYEILRALRDDDWSVIEALTVGDTYSFDMAPTTMAISPTIEVIDGEFYRSFVVDTVERDGNDDIDFSGGGAADAGARLVTVSVFGPTGTTSLSAVLTNLHAI